MGFGLCPDVAPCLIQARIPDLDPTPSELEVAQALSSWNEEPSAELDDHKMLRADSTLELLSEDDGELLAVGLF